MNLIEQLKNEETKLMEKISNTENEATYRNLIRNLAEVTQLRQREEDGQKWTQMYSKYETKSNDEDNFIPVVSVWEQKGDDIRNHRIFEIAKEIDNKEYEMYIDSGKSVIGGLYCNISFDKDIRYIQSATTDDLVEYIKTLIGYKNVTIYVDKRGFGITLYDILKKHEFKVKSIESVKRENL